MMMIDRRVMLGLGSAVIESDDGSHVNGASLVLAH
jgi:hypothetical protein